MSRRNERWKFCSRFRSRREDEPVTWQECLSLIELIELKETGTTRHAEHVNDCLRCQALLRILALSEHTDNVELPAMSHAVPSRVQAKKIEVTPGSIWASESD